MTSSNHPWRAFRPKLKPLSAVQEKQTQQTRTAEQAEAVRKASRTYKAKNPEKVKEAIIAWQKANPEKFRAMINAGKARYYARKALQCPKWLDAAQHAAILEVYKYCAQLNTGPVKYEVDHIVPLHGKLVSGLHVPWNLQVLTKTENAAKRNTHTDNIPS